MNNFNSVNEEAYALITKLVLSDGGDGWGTLIVSDNTFDMHVKAFGESDLAKRCFDKIERSESGDQVVFSFMQESVSVVKRSSSAGKDYSGSYVLRLCL